MKQYSVWLEDSHRIVLFVSEGRKFVHLFHCPTLSHYEMKIDEWVRQVRAGIAREIPITKGVIGRIEETRRRFREYGFKFQDNFVDEVLREIRREG